ncbi:MAG: histidine phosphatase family protein [Lachnospiraceae bacterium]|nr:histidine phosphatase family protein [Lachnospiraceae bacterium]
MRLIFIRHADPDYEHDDLTEKGQREAALLAPRIAAIRNIREIYVSPFGRAQATARPALKLLSREAVTLPWLREFSYRIEDPLTGRLHVPWDLPPEYYTQVPQFFDKDHWYEAPLYQTNPEIPENAPAAYRGFDELMSSHGYRRHGNDAYYHVEEAASSLIPDDDRPGFDHDFHPTDDDETLLFFCHLGAELLLVGRLLGISPVLLWHGIYIAPTAVTVLNEERRYNGNAIFRLQTLGDTSHLKEGGEPVSASGAFGPVLQEINIS